MKERTREAARGWGSALGARARRSVEATAILLVVVLVCETWWVQGVFAPLEVRSGSMAEAIRGPHCRFGCGDCGGAFVCGIDTPDVGRWRVCPHCGGVAENPLPVECAAGDRVVVLPTAFCWRRPRRWEMVALRDPNRPSGVAVKRVVGLPGESVAIRAGDIYIERRIARKEWSTQAGMAVLVYDAAAGGGQTRWRSDKADSGWERVEGGFLCSGSGKLNAGAKHGQDARGTQGMDGRGVDWLVYHHCRRVGDGMEEGPVTDELSYNQWRTQRSDEARPVADLLLRFCAGEMAGEGWLVLRAETGDGLETWFAPSTGVCELRRGKKTIERARVAGRAPKDAVRITFSLFDRELLLAVDGRVVIRHALSSAEPRATGSSRPLAIGSTGLGMRIRELRIHRDVYYRRPPGVYARWGLERPVRLGPGEYFLLGDNSLVSEDSRSWPEGAAVPERQLIGKAVVVRIP